MPVSDGFIPWNLPAQGQAAIKICMNYKIIDSFNENFTKITL